MANFCTLNPLTTYSGLTLAEGNLQTNQGVDGRSRISIATMAMPSSGKFYFEVLCNKRGLGVNNGGVQWGLTKPTSLWWDSVNSRGVNRVGISVNGNDGNSQYLDSPDVTGYIPKTGENAIIDGDVMMLAYDADTGKVWLGKNGVWGNNGGIGDPAAGTNPARTLPTTDTWIPAVSSGTDSGSTQLTVNFGQKPWFFTPPTGFVGLSTENFAEPTLSTVTGKKPQDYFNTVLYTGTGGTQNITGLGFQPDVVWLKMRNSVGEHYIYDVNRGQGELYPSQNWAEDTYDYGGVTSFDSDGFTVFQGPVGNEINFSGNTYVAWCWKAGGSPVSNTDGSITSQVSANTASGFSIVSYTGTGANATVGHGLDKSLDMFIIKNRDTSAGDAWRVWHSSLSPVNSRLVLNETKEIGSAAGLWQDTGADATRFYLDTDARANGSGNEHIAYCFHSVEGFSKFGSYVGNGSTNGPVVNVGFKPAFVLIKRYDAIGQWFIFDNTRSPSNVIKNELYPNANTAEGTAAEKIDFLANGFKLRTTGNDNNASGGTYIYMAIAETPFKYSTAR